MGRRTSVALATSILAVAMLAVSAASLARADSRLFSSHEVLALRLEAPFEDLFAGAKRDPEYAVDGTLADTSTGTKAPADEVGKPIAVRISLRGHTSRRDTECTFPKLKVSLGDRRGQGTIFDGVKTLKIGTHCGETADDTPTRRFGRISNERAPFREVAVYRLIDALGVPTLRARAARVTYVYTDAQTAQGGGAAAPLVRNAMLLEDDDDAIARLGGTKEIPPASFSSADQMFSTADAANLAFAEALIGNFDWCVKFTPTDTYRCDARQKLWNVIGVGMPDGKARPLMYDFDVSGIVVASHRWFPNVFNAAFTPSKNQHEVDVIAQLQRTRSLFPRAELDAARRRFIDRKANAYRAIDQAQVDPDGRRLMHEYADAFYREIESDENFYRPAVVAPDTIPRSDGSPSAPAVCSNRGAIPVGTPVGATLETRGDMIRVVVLDALWHWAPPAKCPPIQSGSVWIEAASVGRDYPSR